MPCSAAPALILTGLGFGRGYLPARLSIGGLRPSLAHNKRSTSGMLATPTFLVLSNHHSHYSDYWLLLFGSMRYMHWELCEVYVAKRYASGQQLPASCAAPAAMSVSAILNAVLVRSVDFLSRSVDNFVKV